MDTSLNTERHQMHQPTRMPSLLTVLAATTAIVVSARHAAAQCSISLQGTAVAGAASYELYTTTARYCNIQCVGGQAFWEQPGSANLVATSAAPSWTVTSAPAFDGGWKVVARAANGSAIGNPQYLGTIGPQTSIGSPYLGTNSTSVEACIGERMTLRLNIAPADVTYQWYRDGVPLNGATQSEYVTQVDASHAGAVYTCVATNACGSQTAGPFVVTVDAGVATGAVNWVSCAEVETTGQSGPYWYCSVYSTTTRRDGSCNAVWTTLAPNAMTFVASGAGSNPLGGLLKGTSVSFEITQTTRMNFTSSSTPVNCFGTLYDRAEAVLAGPVSRDLKPTPTGGGGSVDLPPGVYTIAANVTAPSGFSCTWSCNGCGPMCLTTCYTCSAWGALNLSVSFEPPPSDVPDLYPTIQAAIDATPAGASRTITVAPGVYNQSFALNGKDIVIRGAPNGATILDGAGLATSIARFSGNEPPTAGLERLVFRNGTVGSLIYPKAPFRVGGAVYGSFSSAFIRDCAFESNAADYGGAVYLYRSDILVENCTFASNLGRSESGGMQLYESSGVVAGCTFVDNRASLFGAGAASAFKAVGARTAGGQVLLAECTILSGTGGSGASAVEMFENEDTGGTPGVLRIAGTSINGNTATLGAGGLNVVGDAHSCVLTDGTNICGNSPRNVAGPFLIEGKATVCDCLADVTFDGAVNGGDLGVVLASWGLANADGTGDANHDGSIDGSDLSIVLSNWGACP